jgi:hypothetical protein
VRISPDTGDGGREAGAGRDGDGGGEAEDPAEGRARTGHPGSGIGDGVAMGLMRSHAVVGGSFSSFSLRMTKQLRMRLTR